MVFAPVDQAIREKIISAYLAGHGRNQITRELHGKGIKVSHGRDMPIYDNIQANVLNVSNFP